MVRNERTVHFFKIQISNYANDDFICVEFTNASNALANRKALVEAVQAKIERGN